MKKHLLTLMAIILLCGGNVFASTKLFATFGTPAGNGKWDAEAKSYSWTEGWGNLITVIDNLNGTLGDYTALHLTTSDYTNTYRVCFMNGSTAVATITFYSAGQKDLVFTDRSETKDIDLSQITHIAFGGASGSGSITIDPASLYLEKPTVAKFDDKGKAHFSVYDLDVTNGVSINYATNEITSTGDGSFSIVFAAPQDFSSVNNYAVTCNTSGDYVDIVSSMQIFNANEGIGGWWGSKYGRGDWNSYHEQVGAVTKITYYMNNTAGTMKLDDIVFTSDVITASAGGEDVATAAPWYKRDNKASEFALDDTYNNRNYNPGRSTGSYFGCDNSGENCLWYADLSAYSAVRIYQDGNSNRPRVFFLSNDTQTRNQLSDGLIVWHSEGYFEVDLTQAITGTDLTKMTEIRSAQYTSSVFNKIVFVLKNRVSDYNLSGKGVMTSAAKTVLTDANATIINTTGLLGMGITLTSANPNCIFIANAGSLTNANNVCVDGNITNLALTDGYTFKAPADATASNATYDRVYTTGQKSTLCLPYALSASDLAAAGLTAYKFAGFNGESITFTSVTATEAGKPYMVVKGETGATVAASGTLTLSNVQDIAPVDGLTFVGTFTRQTLTSNTEVSYYGYSAVDGTFVKCAGATVSPFRAYFTLPQSNSVRSFRVVLDDADATGINTVNAANANASVYDLSGRRVTVPSKGLYIVNGKKVLY